MDAVIKPMAQALGVETSTLLAWTVRLVLPVFFFAAWTWLNRDKSQAPWDRTGKQGNVLSKDQILAGRRGSPRGKDTSVPKEFQTLRTEASPASAASTPTAQERGGARERRRRASPTSSGTKAAPSSTGPLSRRLAKDPTQEKARLESLLNHVAFSRTKKDEGGTAPVEKEDISPKAASEAKQANEEARRVLKAAVAECLGPRCAEIARDVFRGLEEKKVAIEATTFTLLIDVCIAAEDLSGVSDFLQRMESDCWPHGPDASLLDRVMGFYSRAKEALDQLPAYPSAPSGDTSGEVTGSLNFGAYSDDE